MIDNSCWLFWARFSRTLFDPAIRLSHKRYSEEVLTSSALIWKSSLLIWTSRESHLEPFQSSYRSQDQLRKQLFISIKSLPRSGRRRQKLPKSRSAINEKLLEDSCQCPQSSAFCIDINWEAAFQERSPCSRQSTLKLVSCRSHGQR